MTLAEFSQLLDASPKWVLNTLKSLGADGRYTLDMARRLTVARALHQEAALPLAKSVEFARQLLRAPYSAASPVALRLSGHGDVALTVDVYRLLSSFHVRLAALRESYAPRARGRPRTRRVTALVSAADWGFDVSLLRDNLRKSPAERIRQLDAMQHFSRTVRRSNGRTLSV